jgi:Fe-S cluster biogenesis protein NfuA
MSEYKYELQQNILKFINNKNYTLITPIEEIKQYEQKFTYKCRCSEERTINWSNIKCSKDFLLNNFVPNCCKKIKKVWYADNEQKEFYEKENKEQWYRYKELWFSNKGGIINSRGNVPKNIQNNVISYNKTNYNYPNILAKLFKVPNYELLSDNNYEAVFKDDNKLLSDLIIIKKADEKKNDKIDGKEYNGFEEESKVVPELEGYILYNTGKIWREKTLKKKEQWANLLEKNGYLILRTADDKKYKIDQLMIYAFKPIEGKTCYNDYNDVKILHKDNNLKNNHILNLSYEEKITIKQTHANNVKNRINKLHQEINNYMNELGGKLVTNINEINTIDDTFTYICKCCISYNRTLKNLKEREKEQRCNTCIQIAKKNSNQDNFINEDGEEFRKNEICFVSSKGRILSFDKKTFHTIRQKDSLVKINNINYNAKILLAKTFKIKYYEFLKDSDYFVSTKDRSRNFSSDNLYVWSNKSELWVNLPDSKEFYEKTKTRRIANINLFIKSDENNVESKDFRGRLFYKNGTFKMRRNLFSKGAENRNGYLQTNFNGKTYKVHKVICFLFNPIEGKSNYEDYDNLDVNHINGDKQDNRAENLEWLNRKDHRNFGIKNEESEQFRPVLQYIKNVDGTKGDFIKRHPTIKEAKKGTGHSTDFIKKLANSTIEDQTKNKKAKFWFEWDN